MAGRDMTNRALWDLTPRVYPKESDWGAQITTLYDTITLVAADSNTQVVGPRIFANSRFLGGWAIWASLGAGSSFTIGDNWGCDRLKSIQAGNNASCEASGRLDGAALGTVWTCDSDVLITDNNACVGVLQVCVYIAAPGPA